MARLAHAPDGQPAPQMGLFASVERRVVDDLRALDIDRLTPVDALNALAKMVTRLRHGGD